MIYGIVIMLAVRAIASSKIYFQEDFNDAGWKSRWTVPSEWRSSVSWICLFFKIDFLTIPYSERNG